MDDQGHPQLYQRTTKTYYDAAGNKVQVVDGNGHAAIYAYDARNRLTAETDALGNTTTYAYDKAGNKIRTTDPRGNATPEVAGDYTTWFKYDDLNRLIQAILPDTTPPVDPFANPEDNPTVAFTYDQVGNKLSEQDPNGNVTKFAYTERYWLKEVEDAAGHQTTFGYDRAGNQISITDARQNTTKNVYDDLNRVMETIDPEYHHRFFYYDAVGNRTKVVDSNYNKTEYAYNALNKLTAVTDAAQGVTRCQYDPNGNLVATIDARGNVTTYAYNELNWLMKEVQEANGAQRTTIYRYDLAGNRREAVDPQGVPAVYAYLANNLLQSVTWGPGRPESVQIGYTYDPSGNRTGMSDPSGATAYTYDPLNQLIEVARTIQGTTYTTGYAYDQAGNLTGIKYPNGSQWLTYSYNNLNQLVGIAGFATGDVSNPAFTYDAAGNLASLRYDNGVTTAYTLDKLNRRTQIQATSPSLPSPVLALNFRYDGEGNILQRNDNLYSYDALDRLQAAQVKSIFHEETGGQPGYASGDLLGKKAINTTLDPGTTVGLDYGSASIGLDFGRQVAAVDTIHLKKDQPGSSTYRMNQKALEVLSSNDNITYTRVADATWKFFDDGKGNYTLTLDAPIDAQVVKVHNRYDDRDEDLGFTDQAQFKNTLEKAISAEQKLNQATLEYVYDAVGNQVEERFTRATTQTMLYTYYLNSNRLLSNGKDAFVYDANGNLIKKGNTYTIGAGQQVTFSTSGEGVEYWEYGYDLRNQLVQVAKNGQVVGSYTYDGEGLRVAGTSAGISRHYIFDPGGRVIYETRVGGGSGGGSNPTTPPDTSYVFAFGQHLAKVAGTIGSGGEVSYYHNDQLGSPMAMTDKTGKVIWSQDYLPYGQDLNENALGGDTRFKFNGKEQDEATGLYYFNARWYDSELGRFITEDTVVDPNNPNLYVYGANNPLRFTDPTGHWIAEDEEEERHGPNKDNPTIGGKSGSSGSLSGSDITTETAYRIIQKYVTFKGQEYSFPNNKNMLWREWTSDSEKLLMAALEQLGITRDILNEMAHAYDPVMYSQGVFSISPGPPPVQVFFDPEFARQYMAENLQSQAPLMLGLMAGFYGAQRVGLLGGTATSNPSGSIGKLMPLPEEIASTFTNGKYTVRVLQKGMMVYRSEGGTFGRWFGAIKPDSAAQAERLYNVAQYGNDLTEVSTYLIPKGTVIYEGPVAGGSGTQIFIWDPKGAGVKLLGTEPLPPAGF